jgi:hypothetical protein
MFDKPDTCIVVECTTFDDLVKLTHLKDTHLTAMFPPNIAGPVPEELYDKYPKWHFGMLGWEGTLNECLCWTAEQAAIKISHAITVLKYQPVFRPPNGVWDRELLGALEALGRQGVNIVTINNPGTKPSGPFLGFYPGNPDCQRNVQIVNASDDILTIPDMTYGLAGFESVQGDPYDDHE